MKPLNFPSSDAKNHKIFCVYMFSDVRIKLNGANHEIKGQSAF